MSGPKLSIIAVCSGCDWLGIAPAGPRLAGCDAGFRVIWRCAHPDGPRAELPGWLGTPDACPLLPEAKAAFVASLTVQPGVVIDGREV